MKSPLLLERLSAVLPLLLLASAFCWPLLFGQFVPGTSQQSLARVMQIEWLAVVGGIFLLFPMMIEPETRVGRWIRILVYLGLLGALAEGSYRLDGIRGVAALVALVLGNYGGIGLFLHNRALWLPGLRWLLSLVLFVSTMLYFGLGEGDISGWDNDPDVIKFGAAFFGLLLLVEAALQILVYPRLGHLSATRNSSPPQYEAQGEALMRRREEHARTLRSLGTGRDRPEEP